MINVCLMNTYILLKLIVYFRKLEKLLVIHLLTFLHKIYFFLHSQPLHTIPSLRKIVLFF
ncbi:hypothetical protein SAMN05421784_11814 [Xenorhabdus koppenhoeferi]|uniref:Uncharacterized protein n=1 Tax=Xenorhabdus koppenhoeferi TaxID=351659 RepID=A0A1I7I4Z0_9GAMM|nr:hypothetical protein SAMN05421784_11814 [Xenorhabdus koppenhoeferi]